MQGISTQQNKSILKSVYCNYRGRVTVYDIHGQKVHELSGMLDYDKYIEIESRSDSNITEFDGIEDYRRIASELKKTNSIESEGEIDGMEGWLHDDEDPFSNTSTNTAHVVIKNNQTVPAQPPIQQKPNTVNPFQNPFRQII